MGFYQNNTSDQWYGAVIPFEVDAGITAPADIQTAIADWETNTVARFVQRTNESDWIRFVQTTNAWSSSKVGRRGGRQDIEVGAGAAVSTLIHEIGHAISLRHEHQRPDRDAFVRVHEDRVIDGKLHNFKKLSGTSNSTWGAYDYTSRMHYGSGSFARNLRYEWTPGWSSVCFYETGGDTYLFMLKWSGAGADGNNVHIHRMNADRTVGARVESHDWTAGWSTAEPFEVAGNQYMFLLKATGAGSDGNNVHIHQITGGGGIGAKVAAYDWTAGWKATFYEAGGDTYLFLWKLRGSGADGNNVHIHRMNADGSVGTKVAGYDWTEGWSTAQPCQVGGNRYLFLLKARGSGADGNNVHIHEITAGGAVGARAASYDWTAGWTEAEFYDAGGNTYLYLMKSNGSGADGNNVHVHQMNNNGSVGARVDSHNWSSGWTDALPYRAGGNSFLFLHKLRYGIVHMHSINGDGTVGGELTGPPTLEALGGNVINSSATLTAGDIGAANSALWGNVHINAMNGNGTVGGKVDVRAWTKGWSVVRPFESGGAPFLFLLKTNGSGGDGNNVHIHQLDADGRVGAQVSSDSWTSGWTSGEFVQIGGSTYLFILKRSGAGADGNNVHVHRMNNDGTVGDRVASYDWTAGWATVEFFVAGGTTYLFLLKESGTGADGNNVHIHQMNNDGSVGARAASYDWTRGWTTASFYETGGSTYLFLLKASGSGADGNNVHIHRMGADGSVGAKVDAHNWSSAWTHAEPYTQGGTLYLFLHKLYNGIVHVHSINADGTVGTQIANYDWKRGWTSSELFRTANGLYLLLLKEKRR